MQVQWGVILAFQLLTSVSEVFFCWNGMSTFIKNQVQSCVVCQQAKPERINYPGLLSPLPVPTQAWDTITMDFISGLPSSYHYECILVIIDKFSKYGHFIALKHPFSAQTVADTFIDHVFKLHGMPRVVVSYRDPLFTSQFWKLLWHKTGAQMNMSTSYHPE